ncbi:hypothetical protein PVAND_017814 [Polypedilum vanderplanki]|uniref:Kynureninase n=1 Tax=Polypedilum vanderplanki TaxID=319348 RepID=A0A9J6B9X2_POLVA|nr:hypothetical protein PVAND_017814 [Polypedilum vanderplanki]
MDLFEIDSLKNNSKNEVEKENILQSNLMTFEECVKADENDELKNFCSKFQIPPNTIYFCGNSLGLCPIESEKVVNQIIQEWEQNHIHSWNLAIQLPLKVGNKIGKLIGAEENETIIADSTSINLFKCLGTSIAIQKIKNPNRRSILLDRENFSNDLGLLKLLSTDEYKIRYFDDENQLEDFLNDDVVCILLSHVNYHHVGSVPINLTEVNADFAVGCTDKYLNSSPGAPAFIYVNKKHQNVTWQPLTGWLGHQSPFKMSKDYEPTVGIKNFLVGTPEVLPISIIDCSVEITLDAGMQLIRKNH